MKTQLSKIRINCLAILLLIFFAFNNLTAQKVSLTNPDKPFLYLSSAYVVSNPINEVTVDPFYSEGVRSVSDKTVRVDLGLQLNRNLSFELGYIRTPLWLTKNLTINNQPISGGGGVSYTRINFYSIKLKHRLSLHKNQILLYTGLGYALGNSGVDLKTLGPSEPKTFTSYGNTITTTSTIKGLHSGKSHFLTFDLGLEIALHKKISLFTNVTIYKGFTDLQEQTIDYNINGTEDSFTTTTDGSFMGLEMGLKYNFR